MKLYKNVGIEDLEKILKEGILPISKTGNDNWTNGRALNSTEVVYLFSPKTEQNCFYQYGAALLEVEVKDAKLNDFVEGDVNAGLYDEYIIDEVKPEEIKSIYIPEVFKGRSTELNHIEDEELKVYLEKYAYYIDTLEEYLSEETLSKVKFVEIECYTKDWEVVDGEDSVEVENKIEDRFVKLFGQVSSINSTYSNYQVAMFDDFNRRVAKIIYKF